MTMTDEEICRDYRAAATPQKQIGILADLNQCSKERIKQILVAGGCELPGNMRPKPKKAAAAPSAEPTSVPMSEVVGVQETLPLLVEGATLTLLVGEAALKVIEELEEEFGNTEDDHFFFRHEVAGVMRLYHEIERRCGE